MSKFLRMEKSDACKPDCYYWPFRGGGCPHRGDEMACSAFNCIFVEDTIIPQKIIMFHTLIEALADCNIGGDLFAVSRVRKIIERAKQIEEATQ